MARTIGLPTASDLDLSIYCMDQTPHVKGIAYDCGTVILRNLLADMIEQVQRTEEDGNYVGADDFQWLAQLKKIEDALRTTMLNGIDCAREAG